MFSMWSASTSAINKKYVLLLGKHKHYLMYIYRNTVKSVLSAKQQGVKHVKHVDKVNDLGRVVAVYTLACATHLNVSIAQCCQ